MATGQSLVAAREQDLLNLALRATAFSAPAGCYVGLFGAAIRLNSTAYSLGNFYVSSTTSNCRVFKCTTAGTSAASQPAGIDTATDGQAITDGTAVFTDTTMLMDGIADATAAFISELSVNAYARVNVGFSNFGAAAAIGGTTTGSRSQNASAIAFPSATPANWNPACGFFTVSASSAGNYWIWSRFSAQLQVNIGQNAQFNPSNLTATVD